MPRRLMSTIKIPVPTKLNDEATTLNRNSARIYNKTLSFIRKIHKKKGFWLSRNTIKKYILRWAANISMHTHSKQAMAEQYFNALKSYFAVIKKNPDARPPFKTKRYMPTIWKAAAIHIRGSKLAFSNGRGNTPFTVPIPHVLLKRIERFKIKIAKLIWDSKNKRYYIHLSVEMDGQSAETSGKVIAVDLGVIHPITAFNGQEVKIWNGGILNSKFQYRHKRLADIQKALSQTKKGSRKYKKLLGAKRRVLRKLSNQTNDILHKTTSNFVNGQKNAVHKQL